MVSVWTPPTDRAAGFVVGSTEWNALMGALGSLRYLYDRGEPWKLVGQNTAEASTNSTSAVDLITVTLTEAIPAATPFLVMANYRKSAGAANSASFYIRKVNATTILAGLGSCSGANQAEDQFAMRYFGPRRTNYTSGNHGLNGGGNVTSSGTFAQNDTLSNNLSAPMPIAPVTSVTIGAAVGNAAITAYVQDVAVYRLAA